ncbi:MAG: FHA domain-containing protein [Saprospiraceae bacterium]
MSRNTEFRNAGSRFGSTIRQSLDLISGRNVNNYTLLFLDPTKQHIRGESKNIVVPYIVLGRNSSCHVQYGDEYPTVSRQHASIQSDEKGCVLIHNPQATNPTYVDGRPISGYHNLESGDEIQLSHDGPRIRFLMDKTVKTSTIGFTRRMSMAIGQSLRPYKRALLVAGALLIGIIGYSIWSTLKVATLDKNQSELSIQIKDAGKELDEYLLTLDSLGVKTKTNSTEIAKTKMNIANVQSRLIGPGGLSRASPSSSSVEVSGLLKELEKNIYYIHVLEFKLPGIEVDMFDEAKQYMLKWSGTGFLASDGRFYTARHVVQPWFYPQEGCDIRALINNYVAKGGSVMIKYVAISPSGDSFTFTGDQVFADPSNDKSDGPYTCGEHEITIDAPVGYSTDYAYIMMGNRKSNIEYNRELSKKLERGETLYIHGYPGGLHLQDDYTLSPVYSEAMVAQEGIRNNVIHVTSMSFVGGNSGGPVFALRGNKLIVIGLAVATYDKIGIVIPAANFR